MPEPRTLTVDPATRRGMVSDLWWANVRSLYGPKGLRYLLAGLVVLTLWRNVVAALAVIGLLVLARMGAWWVRLARTMSKRLPDGQVVSVGHTSGGELVIRDTDEVWLPRGSAVTVQRIGSVTIVHGRSVTAVVPTDLLTDEDTAFLEGHGTEPPPGAATDAPPGLPLSLEITAGVQDDLVRARRRSYLRSGEFGVLLLLPVLLFVVMVAIAEPRTTLVTVLVTSIPAAFGLAGLQRSCAALRRTFPVGHTLRAGADEDGLVLNVVHGALRMGWSDFQAHRLGRRTVELRTRKGRPLSNLTLPREIFTPAGLQLVTAAVPRSF